MTEWVPGLDVAFSRVSRDWCRRRRAEGYCIFVQDLWTGGYANNERLRMVAASNLADAQAEDIIIAGYVNASPWFDAGISVEQAKLNAGSMWDALDVVACDVEITELLATEAQIKDTCDLLGRAGKRTPIYTACWFWNTHLGNPSWPWLREHKIWAAYWDRDPDIDWDQWRFGPWTIDDLCGQQYQGTTAIQSDGISVDVDLNVFDLGYFQEEEQMNEAEVKAATKVLLGFDASTPDAEVIEAMKKIRFQALVSNEVAGHALTGTDWKRVRVLMDFFKLGK